MQVVPPSEAGHGAPMCPVGELRPHWVFPRRAPFQVARRESVAVPPETDTTLSCFLCRVV